MASRLSILGHMLHEYMENLSSYVWSRPGGILEGVPRRANRFGKINQEVDAATYSS